MQMQMHHHQQQQQQQQQNRQQQQQHQQPSTYYKNMATVVSLNGSSITGSSSPRKRMVIKGKGDTGDEAASTNSNSSRGKGVRGSMVSFRSM
jgi:hypothetical protein